MSLLVPVAVIPAAFQQWSWSRKAPAYPVLTAEQLTVSADGE
jgi:hypothetical protein